MVVASATWDWAFVPGSGGGVQTAIVGFVFAGMFVMTGSLVVPIVVRRDDLRVLAMLPVGFEREGA